MLLEVVVGLLCAVVCYVFIYRRKEAPISLLGEHVMITGGSSGIGLAFAAEVAKRGATVTLIARNEGRLEEAKKKTLQHTISSDQKVLTLAADVSSYSETLTGIVTQAEKELGPISMLVNCAGSSVCHRFEETPLKDLEKMLNLNFLGSVYITQAVIPLMKKRKKGRIVFFSSLAGLIGLYGYTAYSASKFALVGMAQALRMEVKPYNIAVTVSFPPDTDTPGFAEEIKTKLLETERISQSAGFFTADAVAAKTLEDSVRGRFMSSLGLEGWLICTLCSGTSPASLWECATQIMTMGISRLILYAYLRSCDKIIEKCASEEENS